MSRGKDLLPEYSHALFTSSAIELCVVQVKYPPVPRFADVEVQGAIQEALSEEYPIYGKEPSFNIVVTPHGINQTSGGDVFRFTTLDKRWSVVVGNEAVGLETREYSEIDELIERFTAILGHVSAHLKLRHQLRFGLRYVNEFRHPQGDRFERWRQLLNQDLLGLAAQNVLGGTIEQTVNELRTRRTDGTLLVRHGFLNGTTVPPSGSNIPSKGGPFYLLDLDYYIEAPMPFNAKPAGRMRDYNSFMYRVFRWAVGDGDLYRLLKGTDQ